MPEDRARPPVPTDPAPEIHDVLHRWARACAKMNTVLLDTRIRMARQLLDRGDG